MSTWTLVIIFGISSWGAGGRSYSDFPNEQSCYKALESMRVTGQKQQSGEDDEQNIAFCIPKRKDDDK